MLDKKFTVPKRLSPFYDIKRVPRKLKRLVKNCCGVHYNILSYNQRMWYYLGTINNDYKHLIITQICLKK